MTRTLEPGDLLSHYRIVGPLGIGGMGEVYRAHDQTLERDVALKVLPPELVKSDERVRRFVLEAKSASSLNHPNIVTIYEIGRESASSDGQDKGLLQGPVHFISMELVTGETLSHKIHEDRTDLKTLLGWLAQAADGIGKAHAAGIVHRDLKPGNIMVSSDGYAKVLDFGLAKLTERGEAAPQAATAAPTELEARTAEGVVMGTAGYMAPEQVVGKTVDHRSDIFSFGCILYEAATRKKPFDAPSGIETMHRILHDNPAPIEDVNPKAPAELRRLIKRALSKSPDQRLQSMKDMAIELREIVDEFETLSASASSGTHGSGGMKSLSRGSFPLVPVLAGVALLAVVGLLVVLFRGGGAGNAKNEAPILKTTMATNRGNVGVPVISPDGRYLAYSSGAFGLEHLWVRQLATGSDISILPTQTIPPYGFVFSPDGNYVYYLAIDPDHDGYKALYQIPTLGGTPVKKLYDIDSPAGFSPDGTEICFERGVPSGRVHQLVIADLTTGKERILAEAREPSTILMTTPAWSHDGKKIATMEQRGQGQVSAYVAIFRVSDGGRESFDSPGFFQVNSLVWAKDDHSLILSAVEDIQNPRPQVLRLSLKDKSLRPITTGFDTYQWVTLTSDGETMAALRNSTVANLYTLDATIPNATPHQVTFSANSENSIANPRPFDAHTVFYESPANGRPSIWSIGIDGTGARPLTNGAGIDVNMRTTPTGAVFQRIEANTVHIWQVDADGERQRALTNGNGENLLSVSLDGQWMAYNRTDDPLKLYVQPVSGDESRVMATDYNSGGTLSPDAGFISYRTSRIRNGVDQFTTVIVRLSDGKEVPMRAVPPQATNVNWSAEGPSLLYFNRADPQWNLFRQELNQDEPEQLTHFTDGRVFAVFPSKNGRKLIVWRQIGPSQNLWLVDRDGGEPVQLTSFQSGSIFNARWSDDEKTIIMNYGLDSRDAVLIKGF